MTPLPKSIPRYKQYTEAVDSVLGLSGGERSRAVKSIPERVLGLRSEGRGMSSERRVNPVTDELRFSWEGSSAQEFSGTKAKADRRRRWTTGRDSCTC